LAGLLVPQDVGRLDVAVEYLAAVAVGQAPRITSWTRRCSVGPSMNEVAMTTVSVSS
jgi:hypothetical protein